MKKRSVVCFLLLTALLLFSCQGGGSGKWYDDLTLSEYITLGSYKGISYTPAAVQPVTDEQLEKAIAALLEKHSSSEELTEGAYQAGDELKMDFEWVYGEGKRASQGYTTSIGAEGFFENFEGGLSVLVGQPIQGEHKLPLTFKADHADPEWAGKTVEFTLTVHQVTRYHNAVLDDAFVQSLQLGVNTVEEYRGYLRLQLEQEAKQQAREADIQGVWNSVLAGSSVKLYPQAELEGYVSYFRSLYTEQAKEAGLEVSDFMMLYYGVGEEELLRDAKGVVKQDLVLYAICQQEGITVKEGDYQSHAQKLCDEKGLSGIADLEKQYSREYIEKSLLLTQLQTALLTWASPASAEQAPAGSSSAATVPASSAA